MNRARIERIIIYTAITAALLWTAAMAICAYTH